MQETREIRTVTDLNDSAILQLVAESDAYLEALYPPESNHAESLAALLGENSTFCAIYANNVPVACGAVKVVDSDPAYGEIKRLFVLESQRGKRLASVLMQHLEEHLLAQGITAVKLEAGPRQPEALRLYEKLGYKERGPFGSYKLDPLSVFMEKDLRP